MTGLDQGDGYDVHGEPSPTRARPSTKCPNMEPHLAHNWVLEIDGIENHRWCDGTDEPITPHHPTPAVARALFCQPGDLVTWGNPGDTNALYRWDGTAWHALQVGDVCRNARDGSAVIWGGPVAGWRKPHIDNSQVDELATVIDPQYPTYEVHQSEADHLTHLARRILEHGYIHTLRAPEVSPAAYHLPRLPYQAGDTVDVTWTNGHTTRHTIESVNPDGTLTLRNR